MTYEEFRQLALEGVFDATVIAEAGVIVDCNEAFLGLLQAEREQVLGMEVKSFAPPDSQEEIQEAIDTGAPRHYTLEGHRPDGTPMGVEIIGRNIEVEGRSLRVSTIRDLTESRQVKHSLKESERRYRSLFEHSADGILVMDRQARPQEVNRRLREMLGYEADEILSMSVDEAVADLADNPMQLSRLIGEASYVVERKLRRKDGSTLDVEVNLSALDDQQILAVIRDISRRREAEAKEVTLRQQLHQAQKLESVGRLAGGIAHDFNNLLTIILANAELVQRSPAQHLGQLDQIIHATSRASELTSQLLLFSRRQGQKSRVIDPNETIREIEKMLRRLLGEDIQLEFDLAPDAGRIRADPGQLTQVVLNLVINARDAVRSGGRINLRTRRLVPADSASPLPPTFQLEVADTGEGISPEAQEHLFEPFFTTKSPGQGTGLGLSTVYGIVTAAGGTVEVHSELGEGARFTVLWPLSEKENPPAGIPVPEELQRNCYRILLVEDEPAVARVLEQTLSLAGHEIVAAGLPAAILERFETEDLSFDLLITDVVMPGMSGPDLAERLQAEHVLFISGYPDATLVARQLTCDPNRLLAKPFTTESLLEAVERIMAGLPLRGA